LFEEALKSKDAQTVAEVAFALSRVAPEFNGLDEALLRLLRTPARRRNAMEIISQMGSNAKFAMPELLKTLEEQSKKIAERSQPAYDMEDGMGFPGGMGGYGAPPDWTVGSALKAIENLGPDAAQAIPLLQKLAQEHSPHRQTARKILKKLGVEYKKPAASEADPFGDPAAGAGEEEMVPDGGSDGGGVGNNPFGSSGAPAGASEADPFSRSGAAGGSGDDPFEG
jgi:hypothetical protein